MEVFVGDVRREFGFDGGEFVEANFVDDLMDRILFVFGDEAVDGGEGAGCDHLDEMGTDSADRKGFFYGNLGKREALFKELQGVFSRIGVRGRSVWFRGVFDGSKMVDEVKEVPAVGLFFERADAVDRAEGFEGFG